MGQESIFENIENQKSFEPEILKPKSAPLYTLMHNSVVVNVIVLQIDNKHR